MVVSLYLFFYLADELNQRWEELGDLIGLNLDFFKLLKEDFIIKKQKFVQFVLMLWWNSGTRIFKLRHLASALCRCHSYHLAHKVYLLWSDHKAKVGVRQQLDTIFVLISEEFCHTWAVFFLLFISPEIIEKLQVFFLKTEKENAHKIMLEWAHGRTLQELVPVLLKMGRHDLVMYIRNDALLVQVETPFVHTC